MSLNLEINSFTSLDFSDAQEAAVSERSRLNHLKPIGVGTPHVESFTSYVARLAASHHVTVLSLIKKEIIPALPERSGSTIHRITYGPNARVINGMGTAPKHWSTALAGLTHREDLDSLSMQRWWELLPPSEVLRPERAWCPDCFEEWRVKDATIYEPLIWFLRPVQLCLYHMKVLANRCPYCSERLPTLSTYYRVGYCSNCMKWLGKSQNHAAHAESTPQTGEMLWQLWVSENVGELLALSTEIPLINKKLVADIFKGLLNKAPRGSMRGFAKWLGIPIQTLKHWCSGRSLPRLTTLLYICRALDVRLVEFITKDNIADDIEIASTNPNIFYEKRINSRRNKDSIREALEAATTSTEVPPPSLLAVARRLKIDAWDLHSMFPGLCKRISARRKQYRRESKSKNFREACEDVRQISLELHNEGIEPTRGRVETRMSKSGYFLNKEVKDALAGIRHELGYENTKSRE